VKAGPLTTLALWLCLVVLVLGIGGLGYLALYATKGLGGMPAEAWRILVAQPLSLPRVFDILAICIVVATLFLVPIALLETRALRAFARSEAQLRLERPEDVVSPYDGVEGDGVAFDGAMGRTLLLKPERGIGAPRVIAFPPVETAVSPTDAPAEGDDRTSPLGS